MAALAGLCCNPGERLASSLLALSLALFMAVHPVQSLAAPPANERSSWLFEKRAAGALSSWSGSARTGIRSEAAGTSLADEAHAPRSRPSRVGEPEGFVILGRHTLGSRVAGVWEIRKHCSPS